MEKAVGIGQELIQNVVATLFTVMIGFISCDIARERGVRIVAGGAMCARSQGLATEVLSEVELSRSVGRAAQCRSRSTLSVLW